MLLPRSPSRIQIPHKAISKYIILLINTSSRYYLPHVTFIVSLSVILRYESMDDLIEDAAKLVDAQKFSSRNLQRWMLNGMPINYRNNSEEETQCGQPATWKIRCWLNRRPTTPPLQQSLNPPSKSSAVS